MKNMPYENPIIPGMHPDPSICRVGEDYYLVTSSFEYFPAIPIFHSRDLVHWKQIGHCIHRKDQIRLRKGFPSGTGIYAPTIRYHEGIFYVITTNVTYGGEDDGNFILWSRDPSQGWSDPIFVHMPGIDPSLYFEDGHAYYTGAHDNQIIFCEIDLATGKRIGTPRYLWSGTGGNDPEGPHLYRKDGWYYLMISEGGTEYGHMVTIARSRTIDGTYEGCDRNPILSNRSRGTAIKAVGHADLVQAQDGSWWGVCLGIRPITYPYKYNLGRETMLFPVTWEEDAFPVMASQGILEESYPAPTFAWDADAAQPSEFLDEFSQDSLDFSWNFLYQPEDSLWRLGKLDGRQGLILQGNGNPLSSADTVAWLGRRQEHHLCTATATLYFPCANPGEEAGMTIYMNNRHHYDIALTRQDQQNYLILRRQIGSLASTEHMVAIPKEEITLRLSATKETYSFSYSMDGEHFLPLGQGECDYLTTEVGGRFTGNYIALYATGNGQPCRCPALFSRFHYQAGEPLRIK